MDLQVGDWVRSSTHGFWQIYRVLTYLDSTQNYNTKRTIVFAKRFVTETYEPAFFEEHCHPFYINKLESDELDKLNKFINKNTKLYQNFLAYEPKNLDCIYSTRICSLNDRDQITKKLENTAYMREVDVKPFLEKLGYVDGLKSPNPGYMTVQFISENYYCVDDHLMFKFWRVAPSHQSTDS